MILDRKGNEESGARAFTAQVPRAAERLELSAAERRVAIEGRTQVPGTASRWSRNSALLGHFARIPHPEPGLTPGARRLHGLLAPYLRRLAKQPSRDPVAAIPYFVRHRDRCDGASAPGFPPFPAVVLRGPLEVTMFNPGHSSISIPECNACGACLICAACGTSPMVGAAVTGSAFLVHLHNCEDSP